MALPLQPDLRPVPRWLSRVVAALALAAVVLALGIAARAPRRPPTVLLTESEPWIYARTVERLIAQARREVWVAVFVARLDVDPDVAPPDDPVAALLRALRDAHRRGIDVRVCLDAGRDFDTGEPDDKHLAALGWLQAQGVHAVADELDVTTHVKAVLVDRRHVVLGSHNWTRSAIMRNREASLLLDDPGLAERLVRDVFARLPGFLPAPP